MNSFLSIQIAWCHLPGAGERSLHTARELLPRLSSGSSGVSIVELELESAATDFARFTSVFVQIEDSVTMPEVVLPNASVGLFHDVLTADGCVHPLLRNRSLAYLCSTERNAAEVGRVSKNRGYLLRYPVTITERTQRSGSWGIVGFCGRPQLEFRIQHLLSVLQLQQRLRCLWLLDEAEIDAALRLLAQYQVQDQVELRWPRTTIRWREVLEETDIAIHTLVSAFGDCGPFLPLSMGLGVPVIVSDFADTAALPASLCCKIPVGVKEASALSAGIEALLGDLRLADRYSSLGYEYANEFHCSDRIAGEFVSVFKR